VKIDLSIPKHRLIFIIVILVVAAIVFTIIGYYGAKSAFEARQLDASPTVTISPTPTVTASISPVSKTSSDIEKLRAEVADLQKQLNEKNTALASKEAGMSTITAYNDFLEYMTQVIDAHDGFSGWTEAEYQIGREKAQATGNSGFVSTVDSAWHDTATDPVVRVVNVYRGIIDGIKGGLNQ